MKLKKNMYLLSFIIFSIIFKTSVNAFDYIDPNCNFLYIDGVTYCVDYNDENTFYKGIVKIGDNYYHFGENSGQLKYGFSKTLNGDEYYSNNEGILQTGFMKHKGNTYYYDPITKSMQKGVIQIGDNYYHFGENSGQLKYGFSKTLNGDEYYSNNEGILQSGFQDIEEKRYYFDSTTKVMHKGIVQIGDNYYHFDEDNGQMYHGFSKTLNGDEYYSNNEGILQSGFIDVIGNRYYFNPDTKKMQKGIVQIEDNLYHFGENSGQLKYGFSKTLNGDVYYSNQYGVIQKGDLIVDGVEYHADLDGKIASGWQTINGHTYYFQKDGTRLTGIQKISGERYLFDSNGILLESNIKVFIDVSSHQGTINWDQLWNSGKIDGVILRMGYWTSEDGRFAEYISNIKRLNIPYSLYLFSYAGNASEAMLEAQNALRIILKYQLNPSMNVYYDLEGYSSSVDNSDHISKDEYQAIAETFINYLKVNGYDTKVYSYYYFILNRFNEKTRSYVDWVALYSNSNYYPYDWRGWQYTDSGNVPGINGNVDISVFKY